MAIFSLMACFTATYAWFYAERNKNNGMNDFGIDDFTGKLASLTVHELVEDNQFVKDGDGNISGYVFNETPSLTITVDWSTRTIYRDGEANMERYSLLQRTNPIFLVFKLTEAYAANEVKITATTESDFIGTNITSFEGNPLSSIVKFSSLTFSSEELATSDYTVSHDDLSDEVYFAQMSTDGSTLDGFVKEQTIFSSESTDSITYIGVVLDYYDLALEYIYYLNLGNSYVSDTENDVYFECDWTMKI